VWFELFDAKSKKVLTEDEYFETLRRIYNERNQHAPIGESDLEDE